MDVYLVDGTYELFRHFFAVPSMKDERGREVGAVRGVVTSIEGMIERGASYIGVATDRIVESFRNELYPAYKTGAGVPPDLRWQFPILEDELQARGILVWRMIEFEADDAMAAAAAKAAQDSRVDTVFICTPDKDLGQCVSGKRIVQLDRRANTIRDEEGVILKFGVRPSSIPDYLALIGDSADGFPGLPRWGKKAAAGLLSVYPHLESVPRDWRTWHNSIRNPASLADSLFRFWDDVLLFRTLATLRTDVHVFDTIEELCIKRSH